MTLSENKTFMISFIEEVINNKNLDAADKIVAEDFIEHIPFPGPRFLKSGWYVVIVSKGHLQ